MIFECEFKGRFYKKKRNVNLCLKRQIELKLNYVSGPPGPAGVSGKRGRKGKKGDPGESGTQVRNTTFNYSCHVCLLKFN